MSGVLIVGAGIGGLTAAIALRQRGIEVRVFESATELSAVGAGIWVPPNAMAVLDSIGLAEEVVAAGMTLRRGEIRDLEGLTLQFLDLADAKRRWGHATVAIRRSELQRILRAALGPAVLNLGAELVRFEDTGSGVVAEFADGSTAEGEMLIGADGLHSTVRGALLPPVRPRYSGQTCFRGLARIDLPDGLDAAGMEIWGGALRFGFSGVGGGEVYWFAPITAAAGHRFEGLPEALAALFAAFPAPVPDLLAATPAGSLIRTDLTDFEPIHRWHRGRVVLLGDAAHASTPNLGQGGAQAMEDALSLAEVVLHHGPTPEAFAEYERIRLPRARKVVELSWRLGRMAHWQRPFACRLRNVALRAIPDRVVLDRMDDLFTPRI